MCAYMCLRFPKTQYEAGFLSRLKLNAHTAPTPKGQQPEVRKCCRNLTN